MDDTVYPSCDEWMGAIRYEYGELGGFHQAYRILSSCDCGRCHDPPPLHPLLHPPRVSLETRYTRMDPRTRMGRRYTVLVQGRDGTPSKQRTPHSESVLRLYSPDRPIPREPLTVCHPPPSTSDSWGHPEVPALGRCPPRRPPTVQPRYRPQAGYK